MTIKNFMNNKRGPASNPKTKKNKSFIGTLLSAIIAIVIVGLIGIASFFGLAKFTTNTILAKDIVQPASSQFFDTNGN